MKREPVKSNEINNEILEEVLTSLKKDFGFNEPPSQNWLKTGNLVFDWFTGGGIPLGKTIEVYAKEGTGKTTLSLWLIKVFQQQEGIGVYLEPEAVTEDERMKEVGVDTERLLHKWPDTVEEVFRIVQKTIDLVKSQIPTIVVLDSLASTSTEEEIVKDFGERTMGSQARALSLGFRKIARKIGGSKVCFLILNQTRTDLNIQFGDNVTTSGGAPPKFYSSIRIELKKVEILKHGDKPYGITVAGFTKKNKCAPPFRRIKFDLLFKSGLDESSFYFHFLKDRKLVDRRGIYYKLPSGASFTRQNFCEKLRDSEFRNEVESIIQEELGEE